MSQPDILSVFAKYQEERAKRIRPDGPTQYIDLATTPFKHFQDDVWVDKTAADPENPALVDGSSCKVLVLGAGFGGLSFAVRAVEGGFSPADVRIVDSAGGFGGTWYWNRYPGLMCDVESYIYMPLLEETGYFPKNKYAYGNELREHAERIADHWKLRESTLFRASVTGAIWDDNDKRWVVTITRKRNHGDDVNITVRAQFVCTASGLLNLPQLPKVPGLDKFKGHSFHTARWDYGYTGGSPTDATLSNLKDKRVAIIGTGATAVQVVPQLAKWAKELYVFQRTPSAVDVRDQKPTDPEWAKEVQAKKGWQRERSDNFHAFTTNTQPAPAVNMVNDGWTQMPSYVALAGGPNQVTMETAAQHVQMLHGVDFARQQRIRDRVDQIVANKETAAKLKAWYPGWCKRPTFHDDYLPAFNLPNVHLVDTEGAGVDALTETGIVVKGVEYPVDLLVFSTGFRSPAIGTPATKAGIQVTGRDGVTLDQKFNTLVGTLHGVMSRGFPNFFVNGPAQAAASPNFAFVIDQLAIHAAYIMSNAVKQAADKDKVSVEPTAEAEEQWAMRCMMGAAAFGGIVGCTPSYFNSEGALDAVVASANVMDQMKFARATIWSQGVSDYLSVLEAWRAEGNLQGLEVKA